MIKENDLFEDQLDGKSVRAKRARTERIIFWIIIAAAILSAIPFVLLCGIIIGVVTVGECC